MLPKAQIQIAAEIRAKIGNGQKATALAKKANMCWIRGIKEFEAPSLFDSQFLDIDVSTNEGIIGGFNHVKSLIEKAFTRCGLTVQCVSARHMFEPNAVTICATGFVHQGIGYDKLNLCFLFYPSQVAKMQDLASRDVEPRTFDLTLQSMKGN
ncbi:hypothetical protein [Sphingobium baderi]|uniref:Uncharacterized protein n=1 Tax=Sphingobium baderi TaxID=1332080 RepID=A0A0S3F2E0_9SPHN|nr:hypothetical protein [Sphingobium baderi]ALR21893.1 hypothetical protein ATN00_17945 [Sphingobium baderi]